MAANREHARDKQRMHNAVYKSQATSQGDSDDGLLSHSTFSVFLRFRGQHGVQNPEIKIEKYNNMLNCFENATEIPMGQRKGFVVVLHKNKIFVLGGRTGNKYLRSVSSYDLNCLNEKVLPEMNVARENFTSISVGKFIYVFGGLGELGELNECERFDTENNTWEVLSSMNVERYFASATVLDGCIYIAGGGTIESLVPTTSFELYDPKTDTWTRLASMNNTRTDFRLMEWNGYLYAMGFKKVIERYNPSKNCWTEIGSFRDSDLIASSVNVNGKLFAIMRNGAFGRVEIDDNGNCTFVLLNESKYRSNFVYFGRHFLYHV